MYRLFWTPEWFNGWDITFGVVGILIALLIAAYSYKIHSVTGKNNFGYFSFAFVLVALSLAIKGFTTSVLYFHPIREATYQLLQPALTGGSLINDLFYRGAFFLHMTSMLGAWLLIFFISQKVRSRLKRYYEVAQIGLFIYFIFLISWVSNFKGMVFYLTSLVITSLIALNYYKNYLNNKNKNTYKVMGAFLFIALSNIFYIFVYFYEGMYVFGEVFMLIGFLMLLHTYRRTMK